MGLGPVYRVFLGSGGSRALRCPPILLRPMPSITPRPASRPIRLLPNALTLANAGLGLLSISKAIDALALRADPNAFERNLEAACWLIVAAGVFDAIDGKVARLTNTFSDLGAQLDSLADALTFGVAPALVAKVLLLSLIHI